MIVVHGFLVPDGRVGLWAESTVPGPVTASRHPFAVEPPAQGEATLQTLLLPGDDAAPWPSPELDPGIEAASASGVAGWLVPAVLIGPGVDPEALLVGAGADASAGASVGYVADVVGFTRDLVRRARVVPVITEEGGQPAARWWPLLTGRDEARLEDLRRAMPGVAHCLPDAIDLLDHVRAAVDALVRDQLTGPLAPSATGWLAALTGPSAAFVAPAGEVRRLREQLDRWVASASPGPVRTCFRLSAQDEFGGTDEFGATDELGDTDESEETPAEASQGWRLEFLLQPLADPSALVPASHVWADAPGPLDTWVDDPQETLLTGLGRASRLHPDIDDALHQPRPTELLLDTAGAHRFLTHAPLLAEAGFGVLVPARWQRRTSVGLTLTVHTRQTTTAVLRDQSANLDGIVDYRWGLALGPRSLTADELVELARAKLPLVRLRGRWVYLDEEQLVRGLAFLASGGTGQMTAGEALRLARLFPEQPLAITAVDGTGWLADLLSGRAAEELVMVDPPASFTGQLRPYQLRGLSWLAFLDRLGVGALLADDMGLGKTVQLLALEALRRETGPRPPTLVVCPLSVLGNWAKEIRRFTPDLSVTVYHGAGRDLDGQPDLVLTTYQVATRDIEMLGQRVWDRVVLDEAQQVKNAATGTARALRQLPARHRVAMTGTPVENRLADLWSIMDFLNPDLLGPASLFRARYSVPVERYGDEEAAARLRRVTRPVVLRRLKTDDAVITDLPEKLERVQWCTLTIEQATLYRAVVDEIFVKLRERGPGHRYKGLVLSAMTKLKQVCNHPAHLLGDGSPLPGRSGKVERLEEILGTALAEGDKALVFTQFAQFGAMLQPHLRHRLGTEVAFLHGGTARGARDQMVERFQDASGPRVLLLSLKAGGTGLNLTAATHVVHVDRWWNPATESQATDRAFRIGQTRNVQVHTLVCQGTIEERIGQLLTAKRAVAESAVHSDVGWLADLSISDLQQLVRLSDD